MRVRSGMILALGAGLLVLGGCAGAAATAGPVTSPTGRVYEPGTRPRQTEESQAATLFIAQQAFEQALREAREGIAADSANPIHYYLAAQALVGMGDYAAADEMYDRAQEIFPAYEIDIEPEREQAWAEAFNAGVEAYNAGNLAQAAEWWTKANTIYDLRSESYLNLAVIHTQEDRYPEAIEAYRGGLAALDRQPATRELTPEEVAERDDARALMVQNLAELLTFTEQFAEAEQLYRQQLEKDPEDVELQANLAVVLARQGKEAEANELYGRILAQPNLDATQLFNVGVALFNARNYERAEEAFRRVTELQPNSRDAWYNYANAIYAQDDYAGLVPVGERLIQLDPLNENSALILARAYRETNQNQKALQVLQRNAAHPVYVQDLQMQPREGRTRVTGTVVGNEAPAGTPVQLRFTFYGPTGELGTQTVTVSAPADEQTASFEVVLENPTPAVAYQYELVR